MISLALAWMFDRGPRWFDTVVGPTQAIEEMRRVTQRLQPGRKLDRFRLIFAHNPSSRDLEIWETRHDGLVGQISSVSGKLYDWRDRAIPQSKEMHTTDEWREINRKLAIRTGIDKVTALDYWGHLVPTFRGDPVYPPIDSGFGVGANQGKIRSFSTPATMPDYPPAKAKIDRNQASLLAKAEYVKTRVGKDVPFDVKVTRTWVLDPPTRTSIPFWQVVARCPTPGYSVSYAYAVNALDGTVSYTNVVKAPAWREASEAPIPLDKRASFDELQFRNAQRYLRLLGQSSLSPDSFTWDSSTEVELRLGHEVLMRIGREGQLLEFGPIRGHGEPPRGEEKEVSWTSAQGLRIAALTGNSSGSKIVVSPGGVRVREVREGLPLINSDAIVTRNDSSGRIISLRRGEVAKNAKISSRKFVSASQTEAAAKALGESVVIAHKSKRNWVEAKATERGWFLRGKELVPAWKVTVMWMRDTGYAEQGGGSEYFFNAENGKPLGRFPSTM